MYNSYILYTLYIIILFLLKNESYVSIHVPRSYLERLNPFVEDRKCIEISD